MKRRNWLSLNKKLIDVSDLDYTLNAIETFLAANNLAFFGQGVLITTRYPVPFSLSLASDSMQIRVGSGVAYDETGYQIVKADGVTALPLLAAPDAGTRWDLLVVRYKAKGETLIPKPEAPTASVYLNIVDGYELAVIAGSDGAYPARGVNDVILAGIRTPAGTANGAGVTLDTNVRENASAQRAFVPSFKQEALTGEDGVYTLAEEPADVASLLVTVNGVALRIDEWTLDGKTLTLGEVPGGASDVYAFYAVNSANSINPVAARQEVPTGAADGLNQSFTLSGKPVDQASTQVYVDGLLVPASDWALLSSGGVSRIAFNAGAIPDAGQEVYAFYLINVLPGVVSQIATPAPSTGGGSSGNSSSWNIEYPQLSTNDVTAGFVTLSHAPANPSQVALDVLGGGAQAYQSDFTVTGSKLEWSNDLGALLNAGDRLRIQYSY